MFEKYTEGARRSLFYARLAVHEHGGDSIEAEHLLLGALKAVPAVGDHLISREHDVEWLRSTVESDLRPGERFPTSKELPFGTSVKTALKRAQEEASATASQNIGVEHLLLAIFGDPRCQQILSTAGVDVEAASRRIRAVVQ